MEGKRSCNQDAFKALGGVAGVRALVNCFYDIMDERPEALKIRDMHPKDLGPTRDNLTLFLCGWLGGPPLYKEKYGSINLTNLHESHAIDIAERDMWLSCMEKALDKQLIEKELQGYLLERLRVPADKICSWCQQQFRPLLRPESHGKV
jgi:hemoglobin